jgi:hypothetical protein
VARQAARASGLAGRIDRALNLVVIRQSDLAPAKDHKIAEFYKLVCDAAKKE